MSLDCIRYFRFKKICNTCYCKHLSFTIKNILNLRAVRPLSHPHIYVGLEAVTAHLVAIHGYAVATYILFIFILPDLRFKFITLFVVTNKLISNRCKISSIFTVKSSYLYYT